MARVEPIYSIVQAMTDQSQCRGTLIEPQNPQALGNAIYYKSNARTPIGRHTARTHSCKLPSPPQAGPRAQHKTHSEDIVDRLAHPATNPAKVCRRSRGLAARYLPPSSVPKRPRATSCVTGLASAHADRRYRRSRSFFANNCRTLVDG